MNEDKLINKYLATLKKVTSITARLKATGEYSGEQLNQITLILADEIPKMVFNDEQIKVLSESNRLKNMSVKVESTKGRGM